MFDLVVESQGNLVPLVALGSKASGGSYLLRIAVAGPVEIVFGRFKQGRPVLIPAGELIYIGSAMKGLASRVLRHASRTDPRTPHAVRDLLLIQLRAIGLQTARQRIPGSKRLHWHIDYLLEHPRVELSQVYLIRSTTRLEGAMARMLADDPAAHVLEEGLGAKDAPGSTHLLRLQADAAWWHTLPDRLKALAAEHRSH